MVLLGIYGFPYRENGFSEAWFNAYLGGYAHVVGAIVSLFDPQLVVSGTVLRGKFSMMIVKTCDAMEIIILLVSAIAAFPGPLRRKLLAMLFGLPLLVSMNVFRLFILYLVGAYIPSWFDIMHIEIWPLIMVVVAVTVFYAAVRTIAKSSPETGLTKAKHHASQ